VIKIQKQTSEKRNDIHAADLCGVATAGCDFCILDWIEQYQVLKQSVIGVVKM
jgi:hypothetical protein